MNFRIINKEDWDRKEYFDYYFSEIPCTYSMTVKLDITTIKKLNQKLYPTMLYFIAKVVNKHSEFRTSFDMDEKLGIFDEMLPCYTIFNKDTETFSNIWTEYSDNYDIFCKSYEKDVEMFRAVKGMIAKPDVPTNNFPVSMVPWTTFEGFNLNIEKGYKYLLPIFTIGRYCEENGRYLLPLAIQVHHGVCDGFHVCRFVNELQKLIENQVLI
ncbi:type A chloramphenicol O-acetyltransferase [Clostridium botulinum]|uniref:Type A chloramphenicol O-acetyltransferase n=1 Tax=Clostridium botulinum TaxID=1491 RepID=A0A6B4JMP3_CLOBO|nr:type A chloramphenicol O-acetyltransferase [Clostridium botulinum]EES48589.1 chloramphenicol O-acetyltransferase [Clostridium botulinum E1 str. 'BoNT E Beluga']MBY6761600.1 type A chloramphenicol O-acetyltransferase [Clostridium botulinum]MBY6920068.1 type A chloramphenicol O-acetyltransferase [Clostridium botulinum]MCR1130957.1 type A chloramphenicol O-acetyltransferase [Clostridium botulinum]NFH68453.1 type A chloramphenicol O-acetyltransferase [Clostridium botulinum]